MTFRLITLPDRYWEPCYHDEESEAVAAFHERADQGGRPRGPIGRPRQYDAGSSNPVEAFLGETGWLPLQLAEAVGVSDGAIRKYTAGKVEPSARCLEVMRRVRAGEDYSSGLPAHSRRPTNVNSKNPLMRYLARRDMSYADAEPVFGRDRGCLRKWATGDRHMPSWLIIELSRLEGEEEGHG